jgi:uncharacterized protein YndB with AHSA1/START domain
MNAQMKEEASTAGEYGTVPEPGTVRLERVLPGPIERVWAYLTESEKRGTWFASGPMELRVGGKLELHFHNSQLAPPSEPVPERFQKYEGMISTGRVTRCEPPHVISFTWDEEHGDKSEVTFELTDRSGKVLLVLTKDLSGSPFGQRSRGWKQNTTNEFRLKVVQTLNRDTVSVAGGLRSRSFRVSLPRLGRRATPSDTSYLKHLNDGNPGVAPRQLRPRQYVARAAKILAEDTQWQCFQANCLVAEGRTFGRALYDSDVLSHLCK